MPELDISEVEDAYTYYVLVVGVPEALFWDADVWFVREVATNKAAYEAWLNAEVAKRREG